MSGEKLQALGNVKAALAELSEVELELLSEQRKAPELLCETWAKLHSTERKIADAKQQMWLLIAPVELAKTA